MKLNPPDFRKAQTFEDYLVELQAWNMITTLEPEKKAIAVCLGLPDRSEHESDIKTKAFRGLGMEVLNKEDGLDKLIEFMKTELGKDDAANLLNTFEEFERFELDPKKHKTIAAYISDFETIKIKLENLKTTLPGSLLCFKLIRKAGCSAVETQSILKDVDLTKTGEEIYKAAKNALKKYKGELVTGGKAEAPSVKLEEVDLAQHEEALLSFGYRKTRGGAWRGRRGSGSSRGSHVRGGGAGAGYQGDGQAVSRYGQASGANDSLVENNEGSSKRRRRNPKDADGNFRRCNICDSINHYANSCPDKGARIEEVNEVEDAFLFTLEKEEERVLLSVEAGCSGVIDTACTSTVCGKSWLEDCYSSMDENERKAVKEFPGGRSFRFGDGRILTSVKSVHLPVVIAGKALTLSTDVVTSTIPMLLSKKVLKKLDTKIDMSDDTAVIMGQKIPLNETSSGHYCISLRGDRVIGNGMKKDDNEEVFLVDLKSCGIKDREKKIKKLHRQFGHTSKERFINLLKSAGAWCDELIPVIDELYLSCEICKVFSRKPPKPAVSMPMASRFNQVVSMDLKKWSDGRHILHIIDLYSRYSVSTFITRKTPTCVINKLMLEWIRIFGIMESLFFDNGGEFTSHEISEVASELNVRIMTTGAESPFQNGVNERIHAITDHMLRKMQADNPKTPVEVLLAWASNARNNLQMWHGFSSSQIVFGTNPVLPNIMTAAPPALDSCSTSEIFRNHLNALKSARESFVQADGDERLRRALRTKMRASEERFNPGESVYYFREGREKWLGPAKVLMQDGKVIFIRHGSEVVKVSANRLQKADPRANTEEKTEADSGKGNTEVEKVMSDTSNKSNPSTKGDTSVIFEEELEGSKAASVPDRVENSTDELVETDIHGEEETESHQDTPDADDGDRDNVDRRTSFDDASNQVTTNSTSTSSAPSRGSKRKADDSNPNSSKSRLITLSRNSRIAYKDRPDDEWKEARIISRACKTTSRDYRNVFNIEPADGGNHLSLNLDRVNDWHRQEPEEINLVLVPSERHDDNDCLKAKEAELKKLEHFGSYEEVEDEGQFKISTRWVLWLKEDEIRARLTARGYEEQNDMPRKSPTISKQTFRTFLAISSSLGYEIKTTDIKSAFLQTNRLKREVFIKPPKEAKVTRGRIWKLKTALYGLNDAALQFFLTVRQLLVDLKMEQSKIDPALFFYRRNGKLLGSICLHVDDFLHAGNEQFEKAIMERVCKRFKAGKQEAKFFKYVGFEIAQNIEGVKINQDNYVENLVIPKMSAERYGEKDQPLKEEECTLLRALVGALNWVSKGTRPDISFEVIDTSMKLQKPNVSDLKKAVKAAVKTKSSTSSLTLPLLGNPETWSIKVFTDASRANLCDKVSSARGYLVFLMGEQKRSALLNWESNKIQRVVKATLSAEALALCDGLSNAILIRRLLQEYLGMNKNSIPIEAYTDNKSLHQAVHSTTAVRDDLLILDIAVIKEFIQKQEVQGIHWIPGTKQLADCLTKRTASSLNLQKIMQAGTGLEEFLV